MPDTTATQIVLKALAADDLGGLLLGHFEYRHIPAGSPSPDVTDLSALLDALYDEVRVRNEPALVAKYGTALRRLLEAKIGVKPVAYAIVFEALRRARNRHPMNFALPLMGDSLRRSIEIFSSELARDFSGAGRGWSNGWLGELERLSKLSQELDGPAFA